MKKLCCMIKKFIAVNCSVIFICLNLAGCNNPAKSIVRDNLTDIQYNEKMKEAQKTPYGKYPENITYTLGKMTSSNNSNMPEGDTYENNAYTRYIKNVLNIQNKDIFEASDSQYETNVSMAISMNQLPDIMIVSNYENLEKLVKYDMIEDLTDSFNNCLTDKIKEMYGSYGEELNNLITFDDKIMALPETNITDGPNLLWLRKDWIDKLGLSEPETVDDAVSIIKEFIEKDPGENGAGNTTGLVVDTEISGECGYSSEYLLDIIFSEYNAYPKQWIEDGDKDIIYGSITDEARDALEYIHELYVDGVIDKDFIIHTSSNIIDMIKEGQCGSFFGPWWAPNNPLASALNNNSNAVWKPYLLSTNDEGETYYHRQNPCYKFVVVRKGYEHPEIAAKLISVMFDKIRTQETDNEEFMKYYQLNVEPTARPLSINVDYKNALELCYKDISDTLKGTKNRPELQLLEKSYYDTCVSYLNDKVKNSQTAAQWAAYTSRVTACSLLSSDKIKEKESLFFGTTDTMKSEWWKLKQKEKSAYLKIICGEEPITYFDEFVDEWNNEGGQHITEEVRRITSEK